VSAGPTLLVFYLFAAIAVWLGLVSLRGGFRFRRYVKAELQRDHAAFSPFVTVFVPCRGLESGLNENLTAIFFQDYPAFEIIIVSDAADDPALAVAEQVRRMLDEHISPSVRSVIAGPATDSGQKVHNLRAAIREASPHAEAFVFVDTDARPQRSWLRSLVRPLNDSGVGAATGYRWFAPVRGGFSSHLRSVWNASIASALGGSDDKNFCWGGSTAIRRATFEQLNVLEKWRGTVSDDFTITRLLHDAGLPIRFVPQCLTPAIEDCSFRELLEFTTRQLKITRAYAPHLWKAVLAGSMIFVLVFFGGIGLVLARAMTGLTYVTPLLLLSVIFVLGSMKSYVRLRAVRLVMEERRLRYLETTLAHILLWPLASLLFLWNAVAAAISRRITWRGITYELKSPTETVIIQRDS